jgi:hypothetical protein
VRVATFNINNINKRLDSGKLVLNVGAHDGLKVGGRLQVLRSGKEIRDPVSCRCAMAHRWETRS